MTMAARHLVEVLAHDPVSVQHLDLVDDVEVAAALPAEESDVAERFET